MQKTLSWLAVTFFASAITLFADAKKPNVIFILTDNHGAWTLGCYGNKEIRTPHIDKLAAEGTLFTRAFCNNSVCSPSRATFLTGLVSSQHGVHTYLGGEKPNAQIGPQAYCTISEFENLPKILTREGYVAGLAGKWHLGDNIRPQEGFSYWFTKPTGHTSKFYGDHAIWQGKEYVETNFITEVITDHAVEFLEQNAKSEKPFFLYLCYNGPYGLGSAVLQPHENRHNEFYNSKNMDSFPRAAEINPYLRGNRPAVNNVQAMRNYAAAVSAVDDGVGRVMETLKRLGVDENTLVVFPADQGLNAGHGGYWGMGDHSRPINTQEATVQIPLIFRHPKNITAGQRSDIMVCNYDFFPTVLDYLGFKRKTENQPQLAGKSFVPVLRGQQVKWDNVIYHEFENTRMIRDDRWKLTIRFPNGPDEFYDMKNDPGETKNLINVGEVAQHRKRLEKQLEQFFAKYADPKYDLWKGGKSKGHRMTAAVVLQDKE